MHFEHAALLQDQQLFALREKLNDLVQTLHALALIAQHAAPGATTPKTQHAAPTQPDCSVHRNVCVGSPLCFTALCVSASECAYVGVWIALARENTCTQKFAGPLRAAPASATNTHRARTCVRRRRLTHAGDSAALHRKHTRECHRVSLRVQHASAA